MPFHYFNFIHHWIYRYLHKKIYRRGLLRFIYKFNWKTILQNRWLLYSPISSPNLFLEADRRRALWVTIGLFSVLQMVNCSLHGLRVSGRAVICSRVLLKFYLYLVPFFVSNWFMLLYDVKENIDVGLDVVYRYSSCLLLHLGELYWHRIKRRRKWEWWWGWPGKIMGVLACMKGVICGTQFIVI